MKLGEIRVSIFRDQKGIPDTLEVLSKVDSSRENFVDRSAVAALRATTINFQISGTPPTPLKKPILGGQKPKWAVSPRRVCATVLKFCRGS